MKLSVLTVPLYDRSLEEALAYLHGLGVQAVELGCGGCPGKTHLDPEVYLNNPEKIAELKELLKKYDMEISALSAHGNGVHPNPEIAAAYTRDFENAVLLAEQLGVETVITFSGCPGDSPTSQYPNWVVCPWPEDFLTILDYQWNEVLIPYWKKEVEFVRAHGVKHVAFEMHPGFCVYNPETCLRLREAVGPELGANFDPSHLIWQGMDPVAAIKELKGAIYHFHAKDTRIDKYNTAKNGVLDTKHYGQIADRSWVFRTVGYGNDTQYWKEMVTALKTNGYDGVLSIEHEDSMMSIQEGLEKAVAVLKEVLIFENAGEMWWA
ncbi:MAG: sugar phosphate isomerase/epimerase [Firmicutes bacterium]|nr:sugar phosphate isomerase/epimerase [Bacillota bacterium]MBR6683690.1 sugar phosphate isomerase/epimerase [Bacillota bacterium]